MPTLHITKYRGYFPQSGMGPILLNIGGISHKAVWARSIVLRYSSPMSTQEQTSNLENVMHTSTDV